MLYEVITNETEAAGMAQDMAHGAAEAAGHAAGAVHGSYYFKVLDDACYFAANSLVSDVFVLTVSFVITSYSIHYTKLYEPPPGRIKRQSSLREKSGRGRLNR